MGKGIQFSNFVLCGGIAVFTASPAHAHFGHLGDLAGHAHWVGAGAAIAAAALGAMVAKAKLGKNQAKNDEDVADDAEAELDSAEVTS